MADHFTWFSAVFASPSWNDLLLGYERGWIEANTIILYAGDKWLADQDQAPVPVQEIAMASPEEKDTVRSWLVILAEAEGLSQAQRALRRWRYLFLNRAVNQSGIADVVLDHVEAVYADFGYPEDMARLSRNMTHLQGNTANWIMDGDHWSQDLVDQARAFLRQELASLSDTES